jgi:carboxypeptidase T
LSVTGTFIDVHSFAGETLFPWGSTSSTAPNASQIQSYARRLGFYNEMPAAKSSVLGAIGGATDDWIYGTLGVPGFTYELKDGGGQFFPTCAYYEASISNQVQDSFLYAMRAVRNPLQLATGPEVVALAAVRGATDTVITANATDVRSLPSTEPSQNINLVELYQTPPWEAGSSPVASFNAADGSFNSTSEAVTLTLANSTLPNAVTMFYVRARDTTNTWGPVSGVFLGSDVLYRNGFE